MGKTYRIKKGPYGPHPEIKVADVIHETASTLTFLRLSRHDGNLYREKESKNCKTHAHFPSYAEAKEALLSLYDKEIARIDGIRGRLWGERVGVYDTSRVE